MKKNSVEPQPEPNATKEFLARRNPTETQKSSIEPQPDLEIAIYFPCTFNFTRT